MVFEIDPKGKIRVIHGYPDGEIAAQFAAQAFPLSIFFIAELSAPEEV